MRPTDWIVLLLGAEEEWPGATAPYRLSEAELQKLLYIVQKMLRTDSPYRYQRNYIGPFSLDVAKGLADLKEEGLVCEARNEDESYESWRATRAGRRAAQDMANSMRRIDLCVALALRTFVGHQSLMHVAGAIYETWPEAKLPSAADG